MIHVGDINSFSSLHLYFLFKAVDDLVMGGLTIFKFINRVWNINMIYSSFSFTVSRWVDDAGWLLEDYILVLCSVSWGI